MFPTQTDDDFLFPIPDWFRSIFLETGILACVLVSDITTIFIITIFITTIFIITTFITTASPTTTTIKIITIIANEIQFGFQLVIVAQLMPQIVAAKHPVLHNIIIFIAVMIIKILS